MNGNRAQLWIEDTLIIDTNHSKKGKYDCIGDMLHGIKIEFVKVSFIINIIFKK